MIRFALAALAATMAVASSTAIARPERKVLVVVSSADALELKDGKVYPTGFYLNELVTPVQALVKAGYTPVFANPQGNRPAMDVHSNDKRYFGNDDVKRQAALAFVDGSAGLAKPVRLDTVARDGIADYAGVFVPGGHAPMQDLLTDAALGSILRAFHLAGKPTALICHGPIALISALEDGGAFVSKLRDGGATPPAPRWIYAGYRMTIFSTAEELSAERGQLGGPMRFYPAAALAVAGGVVSSGTPWQSHVVRDRELITGQNPFSDEALVTAFIAALDGKSGSK